MKKVMVTFLMASLLGISVASAAPQEISVSEPFKGFVLTEGLESPWDIDYGPDNMLWVTERMGKRITRINPETGTKKTAVSINDAFAAGQHQGVLGMAFSPDFLQKNSKNYLYVLYTYKPEANSPEYGYKKLVRYQYDASDETLKNPTVILDKLPAGGDHNGGRVVFGPDEMIYISLGELGHNQFGNAFKEIEAQRLPTEKEVQQKDWSAYVGKVIRLNPDGSIPATNPLLNNVRSHIFTYGHRNPQGLVFVGSNLFECEHGPSTDDELNLLVSGGNYGWPYVAGFQDNQAYRYANWSKAPNKANLKWDANIIDPSVPVQNETDWKAPSNYHDPLKTFYTVRTGYDFNDGKQYKELSYALWPTVAPSSIAYYPEKGPIAAWENSILMTTLKNGSIYQIKLNHAQNNVQGDIVEYFHTQNRYRDLSISPDKATLFVITDSEGTAKGNDQNPTNKVQNPGAILVFKYIPTK